jgi:hypothetical protein
MNRMKALMDTVPGIDEDDARMLCVLLYKRVYEIPAPMSHDERMEVIDDAILELTHQPSRLLNMIEANRWHFNEYDDDEKYSIISTKDYEED